MKTKYMVCVKTWGTEVIDGEERKFAAASVLYIGYSVLKALGYWLCAFKNRKVGEEIGIRVS